MQTSANTVFLANLYSMFYMEKFIPIGDYVCRNAAFNYFLEALNKKITTPFIQLFKNDGILSPKVSALACLNLEQSTPILVQNGRILC